MRSEVKNEITKRSINNGLTGSSWYFRFERLNVIVAPLTNEIRFTTSSFFLEKEKSSESVPLLSKEKISIFENLVQICTELVNEQYNLKNLNDQKKKITINWFLDKLKKI